MINWLKTLAGGLCILTVLLHLVPDGRFARYVKFYAGLLFFLMAARPAIRFLAGDGELERLLKLEFIKEEHYDMETALKGMADLKNDTIMEVYQAEICRQIRDIAAAYHARAETISVQFYEDNAYQIKGLSLTLRMFDQTEAERIRQEISDVYMLAQEQVKITVRGV